MSVPEQIGDWVIEAPLGSGAFATVWLGHSRSLDDRGAIKVLADNWAQNPGVRERFLAEARILRRADHDRIVRVYEYGELADGRPWFAMGLADRGSLRQRMAERLEQGHAWFPPEVAVAYACEIAACLTVVHDLGYIHRDVNPGNVLIRTLASHQRGRSAPGLPADEQILLADLGLAKQQALASGFTSVAGTPAYMAPEQLRADDGIDCRVDVYALMVVTHELAFGRLPAAEPLESEPCCQELRTAIARGIEADPDLRYGSTLEAAAALTAALARDLGPQAHGPATAAEVPADALDGHLGSSPSRDGSLPASSPDAGIEGPGQGKRGARRRGLAGGLAAVGAAAAVVIVVLVTSPATPGRRRDTPLPLGVVLKEPFSVVGAWPTLSEDNRSYGYAVGQYSMKVERPNKTYAMGAPTTAPAGGNIRVKAEATQVTDSDATVGVTCRVGSGLANESSKYVGGVGPDGSWRIMRVDGRGREVLLKAPDRAGYSAAVHPAGANTVELECMGSDGPGAPVLLRLSVNGQPLGEHIDTAGLGAGTVGLAVVTGTAVPVEARFDNVEASRF